MNEDFCSYELSKALKAAGFDEPCLTFYDTNKELGRALDPDNFNYLGEAYQGEWFTDTISAVPLWHAQKWLREKKKIDVLVYNCACGYLWEVSKAMNGTGLIEFDEKGDDESSGCWTSYEGSLSAGISAALELIKKGE